MVTHQRFKKVLSAQPDEVREATAILFVALRPEICVAGAASSWSAALQSGVSESEEACEGKSQGNKAVRKSTCGCHHKRDAGCRWWTDDQKGTRVLPRCEARGNISSLRLETLPPREMMQRALGHVLASRGSTFSMAGLSVADPCLCTMCRYAAQKCLGSASACVSHRAHNVVFIGKNMSGGFNANI